MNALLLALLLATSPDATEALEAEAAGPPTALWVQPAGLAMGHFLGDMLYVPLGANLPLSDATSLGIEVTLVTGDMRDRYDEREDTRGTRFYRLVAAAGPLFSPSGRGLSGFFVQPKLITMASYEPDYAYDMTRHQGGTSAELQLGLDVGWQFSAGNWYFAPVLGASAGYCFNCTEEREGAYQISHVTPPSFYGYSMTRGTRPVLGFNLNLLRVGAAF
jgi:hypothetical protein